ncbi:MAG: hypothetical protein ABWX68_07500 [Arthrobacter sp.]|uniref:hypothetical protein n=1 Tax=Arthrobacter sp. TaxID=1667 RepID=UPI003490E8B8
MQHRIGVTLTASVALCGLLIAASPAQAAELSQTETVATVSVSSATSTTGADAGTPATTSHPVVPTLSDAAPTLTSGTAGQGGIAAEPTTGGAEKGRDTSAPDLAGNGPGGETTTPPTTPPTEEPAPSAEPTEPPSEQAGPGESEGPGEPTTGPGSSEPEPSAPIPTDSEQPTAPEETAPPTIKPTPEESRPDAEAPEGPAGGETPPADDGQNPIDDTVETVDKPEGFDDWSEDDQYEWFAERAAQLIDENWDELQNDEDFQRVVGAIEAFILEGDFEGLEAFLMQEFGEDYGFGLGVFDWVLVGLIEDGSLDEDGVHEAIEEMPTGPQAPGTKPDGPEGFETPPALVPVGPAADVVAAGSADGADASADSRSRQLAATGTDTVVRAGAAGLALLIAGGLLIRLGSRRHRVR